MFVVFLLGPVRGPFPFMKQTPVRSHPPEEVVLQMRKQDESLEIVVMHYVPWAFEFRSTKGWWGQWPSAALVVALVQRWWYEMVDVCRSRFLEASWGIANFPVFWDPFVVSFLMLGWLSDPLTGCWWPPTIGNQVWSRLESPGLFYFSPQKKKMAQFLFEKTVRRKSKNIKGIVPWNFWVKIPTKIMVKLGVPNLLKKCWPRTSRGYIFPVNM